MLIGEVAGRTGISTRMLRHYDRIGLVSPSERTPGGYRRYTEADLHRLLHVETLRSVGLRLQEVAAALDDPSFPPAAAVEALLARTRERLEHERALLERLEQVRAGGPTGWSEVVATIGLIRGLEADDPARRQRHALSVGDGTVAMGRPLAEALLTEDEPNVAGALQWALIRSGEPALALLAEALDGTDEARRHRALAVLEKIGTAEADTVLAARHDADDPLVARRATLALARCGEAAAVPALVAMIAAGHDDVAAADALATLAGLLLPDEPAAEAIRAALAGRHRDGRQRLAAALADVPGPRATTLVRDLQTDADPVVAATARLISEPAHRAGDTSRRGTGRPTPL